MKFGLHSLLFSETFLEKDLPLLDKVKGMGFDAIEIVPFEPEAFPAAKVKQHAADLGLDVVIGYAMPPEANLVSPDPAVRQYGLDFCMRLVDLVHEAGAKLLTGVVYCSWGYLTGKGPTEEEKGLAVENFGKVADHAAKAGVYLGIEPVNRFETYMINTCADALKFIDAMGRDNVRVHLDTFHMMREEASIKGAVKEAGNKLHYIHACENQRGIPGTGLVPWVEFFTALKDIGYDGTVTIESFTPDTEKVARLCCIWRKLADSPEQLATEGKAHIEKVYEEVYGKPRVG